MRCNWRGSHGGVGRLAAASVFSNSTWEQRGGHRLETIGGRFDTKQKRINQETGKHSCTMDNKLRQGNKEE